MVQLYAALWPKNSINQTATVVVIICLIVTVATYRAWPRRSVRREFDLPDISVVVKVSDLFDQTGNLVIGFSDTFDTDTTSGKIISPESVQGQFLQRIYDGDRDRLDREIEQALMGVQKVGEEQPSTKAGKRRRYPIGTVATLGSPGRRYFCVAYSYLQNNLIARSSVNDLWEALNHVWDAARQFGQRKTLVVPVIGSELARISSLDRDSLLKMMILSFVANSRQQDVCKELVVVVHRKDYEKIDMLEVRAFLHTL
ncbi:macro domain-containing protein [Actinophytocola sp.]|uniref:macro domain-containing protein n=1 Tax=Actinophytocola sp. TaxID=1872138 RepID=UPI00389ABFA7